MAYILCKECNSEIEPNTTLCPYCGCQTGLIKAKKVRNYNSLWFILGFFFGPIAWLIALSLKNAHPNMYKRVSAGFILFLIILGILAVTALIINVLDLNVNFSRTGNILSRN